MNAFRRFWAALHGVRIRPEEEPDFMGVRGLSEQDAGHIAATMLISKWADVEYYGPGAAEAEARRRRTLGLDVEPEVEKPKRRRLSKAEKRQRKLEKLRAEVAGLEAEVLK